MTQTSYNDVSTTTENENNGKLLKGMVLGAIIGGALTLLDSTTRNKVTTTTKNMKDSTLDMYSHVKNNPSEVKDDLQERLKSASSVLKGAISDAQNLYEKVNENIIIPVSTVKEESSEILAQAKEAKTDLKVISGKVKEAGEEVIDSSNGQNQGAKK
ncbi:YtxH domain-containing protein [Solibacillus sp. A46]|uniref:YtxH domain-containing protein n=1 Tax=Solibacillus faecavium TaxID=2762221 RepID=A0ABR8XXN9_9BACL|nr:YtxH domain-containing protein [Solibacillus faecavium]MBD8036716.1 YtxH domain-containing protein [Solibacillus faecavium]